MSKLEGVAAIVLAAGRSRRMGAFKPLLPFGKSTVIRSCIQSLQEAGIGETIVVSGHRAEELQAHLSDLDVAFAVNPDPDSEMGTSIACGLSALSRKATAVVIALTDCPAIPPEVITGLVQSWVQGAPLVVPSFNGRGGHPILIDLTFREELLHLSPAGGLRKFIADHQDSLKRLEVESPYIARDLDTWDDYRALHKDVFGLDPPAPPNVEAKSGTGKPN